MRNVRKILIGIVALVTAMASAAYALTIPPTYAPRSFPTQQTHYLRFTFNVTSCVGVLYGSSAGANQQTFCAVKVGALPYNAFVVRGYQQTITAFNSGTTDSISLGTASNTSGTLLVGQSNIYARTTNSPGNGNTIGFAPGTLGTNLTGNGLTPTGADGGFDIYAQYQQTGAAPTAGSVVIVLEYIAPNDGACITPALAATATAC